MKLLTTLLVFAFAILGATAPTGPSSARDLSNEVPSEALLESPPKSDVSDHFAFPGFVGMLTGGNSTTADRFITPDLQDGLLLDNGTCKHVNLVGGGKVGGTTLEAICVDHYGTWWDTSLNLNKCAVNHYGMLDFREDGNFDESCRPCMLVDPMDMAGIVMKCKCLNRDKEGQYAALPLGSHSP